MRTFEKCPIDRLQKYIMPPLSYNATFLADMDEVPMESNIQIESFYLFQINDRFLEKRYRGDGLHREHTVEVTVEVKKETQKAAKKMRVLNRMVHDRATTKAEKSNARRRIEELQAKVKNLNDIGPIQNSIDRKKLFHDNMQELCEGEYGTWGGRIYAYARTVEELKVMINIAQSYSDKYQGIPKSLPERCW